jgi:hypothetical protein
MSLFNEGDIRPPSTQQGDVPQLTAEEVEALRAYAQQQGFRPRVKKQWPACAPSTIEERALASPIPRPTREQEEAMDSFIWRDEQWWVDEKKRHQNFCALPIERKNQIRSDLLYNDVKEPYHLVRFQPIDADFSDDYSPVLIRAADWASAQARFEIIMGITDWARARWSVSVTPWPAKLAA